MTHGVDPMDPLGGGRVDGDGHRFRTPLAQSPYERSEDEFVSEVVRAEPAGDGNPACHAVSPLHGLIADARVGMAVSRALAGGMTEPFS